MSQSHPHSVNRVFLHVPKLRVNDNKSYVSRSFQSKSDVNRIYNLSNINYLEYNDEKKQMTIQFSSGNIETVNEVNSKDIENGSLKQIFQEITRTLFTAEGSRVIQL